MKVYKPQFLHGIPRFSKLGTAGIQRTLSSNKQLIPADPEIELGSFGAAKSLPHNNRHHTDDPEVRTNCRARSVSM